MTTTYIEQWARNRLLADTDITAIVGQRVYNDHLPQNCDLPAIAIRRYLVERTYHMTGQCGLTQCRLMISSFAESVDAVRNLGEEIRLAFSGYKGTTDSYEVGGAFLQDEEIVWDSATETWQMDSIFRVTTFETVPAF